MDERRQFILEKALDIIVRDGYASLTMRALASECDFKLSSLQYYFKTWDTLLESLADYLLDFYRDRWRDSVGPDQSYTLDEYIRFVVAQLDDEFAVKLWPQLWAMAQVYPALGRAIDKIYQHYLDSIADLLAADDRQNQAIVVMATLEGLLLFIGRGRRWAKNRSAVKEILLSSLESLDRNASDCKKVL